MSSRFEKPRPSDGIFLHRAEMGTALLAALHDQLFLEDEGDRHMSYSLAMVSFRITDTRLLHTNRDGPVAGGVHVFTGMELASVIAGGKVATQTDHNPGTDSPHDSGRNLNCYG